MREERCEHLASLISFSVFLIILDRMADVKLCALMRIVCPAGALAHRHLFYSATLRDLFNFCPTQSQLIKEELELRHIPVRTGNPRSCPEHLGVEDNKWWRRIIVMRKTLTKSLNWTYKCYFRTKVMEFIKVQIFLNNLCFSTFDVYSEQD